MMSVVDVFAFVLLLLFVVARVVLSENMGRLVRFEGSECVRPEAVWLLLVFVYSATYMVCRDCMALHMDSSSMSSKKVRVPA